MSTNDFDYSPGESQYFATGGDTSGVETELGRGGGHSAAPDTSDGLPQLSDAEQRYFETGDVTHELAREYSDAPPEHQRDEYIPPRALEAFQRIVRGERIARHETELAHARADERNKMLVEALSPPQPEYQPPLRMQFDEDPLGYLKERADRQDRRETEAYWNQREQAQLNHYQQSMSQRAAQDSEFRQGYVNWLTSRAIELAGRYYLDATPDQIVNAYRQGQIDPQVVQAVTQALRADEQSVYKNAIASGQNPADVVERLMVGRTGYKTSRTRAAEAHEQPRQREAAAAAQRKADQAERDWRARVAARAAAVPGVSMRDAVAEVLPNWDDRQRYWQGIRNRA